MPRVVSSIDVAGLADGTQHKLSLEVVALGDGAELRLPVKVLAGRGARPVFVLIAGIHGDEAEGILALLDLWQAIDPRDLCGRMDIVPVANPPAFAAGRRTSPIDDLDLNRVFPGRRDGSITQQLAHVLFHRLVAGADLLLTLHSWYSQGVAEDFIECPRALAGGGAKAREAALASGFGGFACSTRRPGCSPRLPTMPGFRRSRPRSAASAAARPKAAAAIAAMSGRCSAISA
jgi:predicted deacylase